jgi:hypothetical protein
LDLIAPPAGVEDLDASEATGLVRVASQTSKGGHVLKETYSFRIEGRTAPRVIGAMATGPKTVRVSFDEPILVPPGAHLLLIPRAAPAVAVVATSTSVDSHVLTLGLDTEMTSGVPYEVRSEG